MITKGGKYRCLCGSLIAPQKSSFGEKWDKYVFLCDNCSVEHYLPKDHEDAKRVKEV